MQNNKFEEAKAKIELIKNEPLDPNIDDTIKNILTKLVEQDEFSTIYQIITKVIKDSKNVRIKKKILICSISLKTNEVLFIFYFFFSSYREKMYWLAEF